MIDEWVKTAFCLHRVDCQPCSLLSSNTSTRVTLTMVKNYFSDPIINIVSALWDKREATEQVRHSGRFNEKRS